MPEDATRGNPAGPEMGSSKTPLQDIITDWMAAWNRHDLQAVVALFDENAVFEAWTGAKVGGKARIMGAWSAWFADHGDFHFKVEDLVIDESSQKVAMVWRLTWPSTEDAYRGEPESRRGADVLHFANGKVTSKSTFSQTVLQISGKWVPLAAR